MCQFGADLLSPGVGGLEARTVEGMARPLREQLPGGVYHVGARGVDRCSIYRDLDDRRLFLCLIELAAQRTDVIVRAYCLMTTHYHLVVETPELSLSKALQLVNGRYAQLFNDRHQRVGHLFQGRFWADLIESDEQFENVCRYVVNNPVRAGLVKRWREWPWARYSPEGSCVRGPW